MLLIKHTPTSEVVWHVGEPFPAISGTIHLIQADCDELNFIQRHFKNLPLVLNDKGLSYRTQIWTGEWATYICHNIAGMVSKTGEVFP